jgi:hypothetical protein
LHASELEEQYYYRSIRSEFVIVGYHNDLFADVKTFSKIEKVTEMALIKTGKFYGRRSMVKISCGLVDQ